MTSFDIRGRLPDMPSEQTLDKYLVYVTILLAMLGTAIGIALIVSGIVLVAMMAVQSSIVGVIAASLMLGAGIVLSAATYIWLTI